MSSSQCQRYFQQLQEIEARIQALREAAGELRRNRPGWIFDAESIPDAQWSRYFDVALTRLNSTEVQQLITDALEKEGRTNIGGDPPQLLPVRWMLKNMTPETAQDYLNLSQLIVGGRDLMDPSFQARLSATYGNERIAGMIKQAYQDFLDPGKAPRLLERMAADTAPFLNMVERLTRQRVANQAFNDNYLERVADMAEVLEAGGSVTPDQRRGLLKSWKAAMIAQSHFDLMRRRTGQALRSLQENPGLPSAILNDLDIYLNPDDFADPVSGPGPDAAAPGGAAGAAAGGNGAAVIQPDLELQELRDALTLTPEDALRPNNHFVRVAEAINEGRSNPRRAADKLRGLYASAKAGGVRPRPGLDNRSDFFNYYMKLGNSLAKDSMLAQAGSQNLNLRSNILMALYGPTRTAIENAGNVTAYGTKATRQNRITALMTAWEATGEALALTRLHYKALFSDAFNRGINAYGGSVDTYGDGLLRLGVDENARMVDSWREFMGASPPGGWSLGAMDSYTRFWWTLKKGQAAFRLLLHDQFRVPAQLLTPGYRMMAGVDNVGGYFFRTMRLRNELLMQGRFNPDLGLQGPDALERWVDEQFAYEMEGITPSEREVKRYRADNNLPSNVSDQQVIEQMLVDRSNYMREMGGEGQIEIPYGERLEYGIPRPDTEAGGEAGRFSEQMRFQTPLAEMGPAGRAVQQARRAWWVDQALPFVQAPLRGTLFDVQLALAPLMDLAGAVRWQKMSVRERSLMQARWIVSGMLLASFIALDVADGNREDLIIGNGPSDPKQRQEWLTRITAMGRQPNTINGVSVGGVPILNTLMMWRDIKDAVMRGAVSKADQGEGLMRVMTALTAQLAVAGQGSMDVTAGVIQRMPGVSQVRFLMDLLNNRNSGRSIDKMAGFLGYQVGSAGNPLSGPSRMVGRMFNRQLSNSEQPGEPPEAQVVAGLDDSMVDKSMENLQRFVNGVLGMNAPLIGFSQRQTDWLGHPISLPWGLRDLDALKDFAMPQLWPEGDLKVYGELDARDRLNPPVAIASKRLAGVAMDDELLMEYVQTRSQIRGSDNPMADMVKLSVMPAVDLPVGAKGITPEGISYTATTNLGKALQIPLGVVVADAIRGRTEVEAYRALFDDPRYRALMDDPVTTADRSRATRTTQQINNTPPMRLIDTIREFYSLQTFTQLRLSDSPAAVDWQRKYLQLTDQNARNQTSTEGFRRTIEAINGRPPQ